MEQHSGHESHEPAWPPPRLRATNALGLLIFQGLGGDVPVNRHRIGSDPVMNTLFGTTAIGWND
jgi:hypothetical protein